MRDRLIKLLCGVECDGEEQFGNCPQRRDGKCRTVQKLEMCQIGAIADHLLANGVIVPRIKVGDHIYYKQRGKTISAKVFYLNVTLMEDYVRISEANATSEDGFTVEFDEDSIGKTVFLSREEAEQAMKGEHHG